MWWIKWSFRAWFGSHVPWWCLNFRSLKFRCQSSIPDVVIGMKCVLEQMCSPVSRVRCVSRWATQEMILNERRKVLAAPSIAAGRAEILATFLVRSNAWWYTLLVRDRILSDRMQETLSEWMCSDDPCPMKSLNKLWSWAKSTDLHIFCTYAWWLHIHPFYVQVLPPQADQLIQHDPFANRPDCELESVCWSLICLSPA